MWIVTTVFLAAFVVYLLLKLRTLTRQYTEMRDEANESLDIRDELLDVKDREEAKYISTIESQNREIESLRTNRDGLMRQSSSARDERDTAKAQAVQLAEECARWREKAENADRTITHLNQQRTDLESQLAEHRSPSRAEVELANKLGRLIAAVKKGTISNIADVLAEVGHHESTPAVKATF